MPDINNELFKNISWHSQFSSKDYLKRIDLVQLETTELAQLAIEDTKHKIIQDLFEQQEAYFNNLREALGLTLEEFVRDYVIVKDDLEMESLDALDFDNLVIRVRQPIRVAHKDDINAKME